MVRAVALALGALATAGQVLLLRETLVVLEGNELSLAVSLAAWLLGVGAGAAVGGRAADRLRRPEVLASLAIAGASLIVPGSIVALRCARALLGIEGGAVVPPLQAMGLCLLVLSPASFGVGLCFAPLARSAAAGPGGGPASVVYGWEAVGAVVGGAGMSLVLLGRVAPLPIAAGASALATGLAAGLLAARRAGPVVAALAGLALLLAVAALAGPAAALDRWSAEARWVASEAPGRRVASLDSPYQRLDLAEVEGQHDLYSNGTPLLSFPDPWDRVGPVHVAVTEEGRGPGRVLLLGRGASDRLAALLDHGPSRVDLVELDPAELEIVRPFLPERDRRALGDPRVRLLNTDGRRLLARARPASYDLIVLEAPDPVTALANRYSTRELVEACGRALTTRGVLATRIGSAGGHAGEEAGAAAASLLASLDAVFGHVALAPGDPIRFYASRSAGVVTEDETELGRRWRARSSAVPGWDEHRFEALFPRDQIAATRAALAATPAMPNRDARPISFLFGLVLWDQRARGAGSQSPLWALRGVTLPWLLAPLLLLLALRLLWPRRSARALAFDGGFAVLTSGLAGLALEVVLLLAFQNVAGSLYQELGLLVAVFMAGLAGGTAAAARLCRGGEVRRTRRVALGVDLLAAAAALATLLVPAAGSASAWIAAAVLGLAGFATGATFPPAVGLIVEGLGPTAAGRAAGLADAADHLGACVGALVVGLLALPVTGVLGAALSVAVLKLASAVGHARPVSGSSPRPGEGDAILAR